MKVNINKLQQGGAMPFVSYEPLAPMQQTQSPEPKESKSDSKGGVELLSKEVINEVIKSGMPNEVESFMKSLKQLEQTSPYSSGMDTSQVYNLASKANQIIHNAGIMKEATTKAYESGGLDELALTTTGGLYVRGEDGGLSTISTNEFAKNRDKYQALTVNDLSQARRYDSKLSFDKNVISSVQNAVGIDKISDHIVDVLKKLGTESNESNQYTSKSSVNNIYSSEKASFGKTPTQAQTSGLQELKDIYNRMGSEGIYNLKTSSETQRNHIKEAASFILSTMSPNAVNLLKARAVVNGNSATPENLVMAAFGSFTSEGHKSDITYNSEMSKVEDGTNGTGTSKDKQFNLGGLEMLLTGEINNRDFSITNPDDASYTLTMPSTVIPTVLGTDNKPIQPNILRKVIDNKEGNGIAPLIDRTKMFFGNKRISNFELDQIIYDGGHMAKTYVPVDDNGDPDFKLLTRYTDAEKHITADNITSISEKNKVYKQFGLNIALDANGKPTNGSQVKEFLVFTGSTSKGTNVGDNNSFSYEPKDQSGEKKRMEDIFKSKENGLNYPDSWWGPGMSNAVTAPIFIKLDPSAKNTLASMSGHGSLVKTPTLQTSMIQEQSNHPIYANSNVLQNNK